MQPGGVGSTPRAPGHQVGPLVQEQMGGVVVPILGCKAQGGPAVLICQVGVGAVLQERGTEVGLLVLGSDKEGWVATGCMAVHVHLVGQQQPHSLQVAPGQQEVEGVTLFS